MAEKLVCFCFHINMGLSPQLMKQLRAARSRCSLQRLVEGECTLQIGVYLRAYVSVISRTSLAPQIVSFPSSHTTMAKDRIPAGAAQTAPLKAQRKVSILPRAPRLCQRASGLCGLWSVRVSAPTPPPQWGLEPQPDSPRKRSHHRRLVALLPSFQPSPCQVTHIERLV